MLEKKIERKVCKTVLDVLGVASCKLTTPGKAGYPDRMFFIPGGRPLFIEFKRPGETPEPLQVLIHHMLRALGYDVEVHDDHDSAVSAVRAALHAAQVPKGRHKVSP
jgi:hypothetical protein